MLIHAYTNAYTESANVNENGGVLYIILYIILLYSILYKTFFKIFVYKIFFNFLCNMEYFVIQRHLYSHSVKVFTILYDQIEQQFKIRKLHYISIQYLLDRIRPFVQIRLKHTYDRSLPCYQ